MYRWFSLGIPVFSTNKTEIMLKMALNTTTLPLVIAYIIGYSMHIKKIVSYFGKLDNTNLTTVT
jgi:hypothetical protein